MKNHSSPEPAAHSTLLSHFCARTFGKRYNLFPKMNLPTSAAPR